MTCTFFVPPPRTFFIRHRHYLQSKCHLLSSVLNTSQACRSAANQIQLPRGKSTEEVLGMRLKMHRANRAGLVPVLAMRLQMYRANRANLVPVLGPRKLRFLRDLLEWQSGLNEGNTR